MLLAALGVIATSAVWAATSSADSGPIWSAVEAAEAPTVPYVGTVMNAKDVVESRAADATSSCIWIPPAIMECRVRDANQQVDEHRRNVDGTLDGPSNLVPPVLETPPDGSCVPVEDRALSCTRGGSGGGSSGRTYYMGNRQYECEFAAAGMAYTNDHIPKVVYNSMRFCRGMQGFIKSVRRDWTVDSETWASGSGPSGTLISKSFSARFRRNYCQNTSDHSSYVRCAYDWVR